jgi:ankyrin repeat protein
MARDKLEGLKGFLQDLVEQGRECEALCEAFRWGLVDEAKEMLESGCDINCRSPVGSTPVMYAASGQSLRTVKLAKEHAADVNLVSHDGSTALHYLFMSIATDKKSLPILKVLLEMGADPTVATASGETPLDLARQKSCDNCVVVLAEASR